VNGPTALEGLEPTPGGRGATRERSGSHVVAAWLAWALAVVAGVLGIVFGVAERATRTSIVEQTILSYLATAIVATVYASVGLALHRRRAQPIIGWLFLGFGVIAGLANASWAYVLLQAARGYPPANVDAHEIAWLASLFLAPAWLVVATALLALFPNGRPVSQRWSRLLPATLLAGVVLAVCLALMPGPLVFYAFANNPHGATGRAADVVRIATPIALVSMVGFVAFATWSLRLRYARAESIERLQLRWFAWACALVVVGSAIEIVLVGVLVVDTAAGDLAWLIFMAAAITVPLAALVAIMRYRLYDIDRLISKTFVLGALTAILAGLYTASLRMFTALFVGVTGENSDAALVLTTLVLATSFTPVKQRLEGIANERFKAHSNAANMLDQPGDDLDARMEAIARRVSQEVLAEARAEMTTAPGNGPFGPS